MFYNFISKPDKNLYKEYYEIIKHPVSLRAILRLVRGTDNRKNSLKRSPFRTWDALEEEVSYIWRNASEFNEPGSAIVEEAEHLKKYFLERLAEVRKVVPDPPPSSEPLNSPAATPVSGPLGTRLKLKMPGSAQAETPQRITLRLNGKNQTESPGAQDAQDQTVKNQSEQPEPTETPRTRSLRERPSRTASQKTTAPPVEPSPQRKPAAVKHESVTPSVANGAGVQQGNSGATQARQQPYMPEPAMGTPTPNAAAVPVNTQYPTQPTGQANVQAAPMTTGTTTPQVTTPAQVALEQFRNPQQANARNNKIRKGMNLTCILNCIFISRTYITAC